MIFYNKFLLLKMAALGPKVRKTSPRKSPRFGPRLQTLREKESLELGRTDFTYKDFEKGTPRAKVEMLSIRPDIALGKAAGRDLEDIQYRIYFIIKKTKNQKSKKYGKQCNCYKYSIS